MSLNKIPPSNAITPPPRSAEKSTPPGHPVRNLTALLRQSTDGSLEAKVLKVQNMTHEQQNLLMDSAKARNSANEKQLLQSQNLKLVTLEAGKRTWFSYSDQPLKAGQTIRVQLTPDSQLAIISHALDSRHGLTVAKQQLIQQALRQTLPEQQSTSRLLKGVFHLFSRVSPAVIKQLLPQTLYHDLIRLKSQVKTPHQLFQINTQSTGNSTQPLSSGLKHSGLFLENQLKLTAQASSPGSLQSTYHRDVKALLLRIINQLEQATASSHSKSAISIQQLSEQLQASLRQQSLSPSQQQLQGQLVAWLYQTSRQALASIRYQQLLALVKQLDIVDKATDTQEIQGPRHQSWQFELPVRYGQEVYPVKITIDEKESENDEGNANNSAGNNGKKPTEKACRWEVMLTLDLPDAGHLYAHLSVIQNNLSAKLWAEEPQTLTLAKSQLSTLHNKLNSSGIKVEDIRCFPGHPPIKKENLHYSLVDIMT